MNALVGIAMVVGFIIAVMLLGMTLDFVQSLGIAEGAM